MVKRRILQVVLVVLCAVVALLLARLTHATDLVTPQPWIGR